MVLRAQGQPSLRIYLWHVTVLPYLLVLECIIDSVLHNKYNQLEKLEAARSAYIMLLLVIFPHLWLHFLAFRFTEPYWATGPYCA